MIIDLHKHLFIGHKEELNTFFERAQEEGVVQFLTRLPKKGVLFPPDIHATMEAIKLLRKQPLKKIYEGAYSRAQAEKFVDRIIELKKEIESFEEERVYLESEIARVIPVGDFSMEDIEFIEREGKLKTQFFCIKSKKAGVITLSEELIYITTEYDLDYFVTFSSEKKTFPNMIEVHVEKTARELRAHLSFVHESLHELEAELKGFSGHIPYLRRYLVEALNDYHLYEAKTGVDFPLEHSLFSIEGWVPKNKLSQLEALTENLSIVCERIAVEKSDRVPTYMENKGINHIGEDLVNIYDIPAPEDRDPSGFVFWSFALFFAFIVADGGYGLLYLILAGYIKYKFPDLKGKARRFYRLMVILSSSCVIWGILSGSFFGIEFRPDSVVSRASLFQYLTTKKAEYHIQRRDEVYRELVNKIPSLKDAKTGKEFLQLGVKVQNGKEKFVVSDKFKDSIFFEVSLLIGVMHLSLSLLRYVRRNWASAGWFLALIGGYVHFSHFLKASSLVHFFAFIEQARLEKFCLQLLIFGIALAIVLALVQKRFRGVGEITTAVQIFGDILSYLRLYALGLATTILAQTSNDLGYDVGLFLGVIVVIAGHSVNIALGIMSGVIHGLRLNFIEWYHYSYVGGGKLFNPLRKLTVK